MDSHLIDKFEQQLRELLVELDALEQGSKSATATVVLDQTSVGRLSRMDAMQGQQMAMESERRRKQQILQVRAALQRIRDEDFGYCFGCGEEIPPGRLAINPATTHCVTCAE